MAKTNFKRLSVLVLVALTGLSMISFAAWASVAANFTVDNSAGNSEVGPSDTNHEVLEVDLPDTAGTDSLLLNGAGYAVADGNALTAFAANEKYSDSDHDDGNDYSGAELIVNSADSTITSGEVVTPGTAGLLANWTTGQNIQFSDGDHDDAQDYAGTELVVDSADTTVTAGEIVNDGTAGLVGFGTSEPNLDIYLDHGTNDDTFNSGEDIFYQEHNGSDTYSTGDTIQAFSANELSFYDDASTLNTAYDDGEAIITDGDSDGYPSSGDTVVTAGKATVEALTTGDDVCFDGSVSDDTEFDTGEIIWWDAGGDCSAFTTTTDVILVGGAAPSGTSREFGTEQEVAFLDDNNDGSYTCTRAGTCEPIVHYGANTDFSDDDDLPTTTVFFDSSTEGTDGIATTGTGWDESGGAEDLIDFAAASATFGYISTGAYVDGDDIFGMTTNGGSAVFADGDESRLFVNGWYSDADNSTWYDDGELVATSADNILSGGEIIVSGTVDLTVFGGNFKYSDADNDTLLTGGELIADDANTDNNLASSEIVYSGTVDLQAFSSNFMYHDGSGDTNYTDGEDVVDDADASTYYNADQLVSIIIGNPGTCVDGDLAAIKIYEDDGDDVFDGGDTLIGSDTSSPFIGQTITTNTTANGTAVSSIYTSSGNPRTIYATIDTVASPTHGCTFQGRIPQNGVVLLSNNDGPTDTFVGTSNVVTVDSLVTITDANISITSNGTGTAGVEQYIINDTLTVEWDDSVATGDGNGDIAGTPTVDFSSFDGGAAVAMRDDGNGCDTTGSDDKWCASYTIAAGATDSGTLNNLNVSVSATDDQGNNATTGDTTGLDCDDIAPNITANGTLTITTDNGVASVAAVNGGAVNPDKVTQSTVTLSAADGDTTTIDLTALTGEGTLAAGVESGNVTAGALDSGSQTFTITVTDNAGNTDTTASDAISVDNTLPSITNNGTLTITTDNGVGGTAALNDGSTNQDKVTQSTVTLAAADGDTETTDFSGLTGEATLANGVESGVVVPGALDNGSQTFTITVTDNAGNVITGSTDALSVDNIAPNITDNGSLSISTDNVVVGVAAVNDGVTNQDKVTQSVVSLSAADGDTQTTNFTALTGQAAVANGVESGVVTAGALDNATQTFTITVTDDGGNIATTATDPISVDNTLPNITNNGTLTISTDNGTGGVAAVNGGGTSPDKVTQSTVTLAAADGDTETTNFTALTGEASVANGVESGDVIAGAIDSGSQTFTITVVDNAGNSVSASTDAISVDNDLPDVTAANVTVTGCTGTGGACKNGDTPTLNWLGDTDGEGDTIASSTFDGSNFKAGDTALAAADPGTPGTNNWSVGLSGAMDAQDDTGNTIDVTVVDNGGNSVSVTSAVGYTVDTNAPTVTAANITVTGCTGTGGACKNGDTPTLNWLGDTDGETDTIASATFDGSNFRAGDGALAAADPGTPGTNDWSVGLSGAMDAQDDTGNTIDVTVVDNAGNTSGAVTSSTGYVVDTNAPTITDNGTLTITTDGGTASLCEIGDKVTQTAATVASADSDTTTINLLAPNNLTGEAALASGVESAAAAGNGLDNAAMTFTVTVTDDAGNTDTTASDAIAVYTVAPGTLGSTSVTLSETEINQNTSFTIDFTTVNNWPADGMFQITFPANFDVSGLNAQNATSLTNVDGVLTAAVVGQVVTLTRDGSGTQTAGGTAVTFTISTGTNGGTAGATGTFDFKMQNNSGGVLDEDTAVSGVTLTSPAATGTGGTLLGGGGGGGSSDSTSNTKTSDPRDLSGTVEYDRTFSAPVELDESMINEDPDTGDKSADLTGDGKLTIKPNSKSTISVEIPTDTSVSAGSEWDGIIYPPLIKSTGYVGADGEPIEGTDSMLYRNDVDMVVSIGSVDEPIYLSNPATLKIPFDEDDGTMVRVLWSPDGETWEDFGVYEVQDGYLTFETDHFSYFAFSTALAESLDAGTEPEVTSAFFTDTVGHWAEEIIDEVAARGIVNGKSEGIFEPNSNITRAELTKIAVFAFGYEVPDSVTEQSFGDVEIDAWYAAVIQVAKDNNLVEGYEGNIFKPNDYISRAAALKILLEAAGYDTVGMITVEFSDTTADAWYMKYVNFAKLNDIVNGYEDGTFRPGNYITRAEVAKIVLFILELDPEMVVYPAPLEEEEAVVEDDTAAEEEIGVDTGNGYRDVTAEEAKTLVDTEENLVIIDVASDYDNEHIPGALGYYLGDGSLDDAIPGLDAEKTYLVYCRVASAAMEGAQKLADAGLTVYRLDGDYAAWVDAEYEVAMCYDTIETSAEVDDHVHHWCEDWENTAEYCDEAEVCHSHVIDLEMNLAEEAGEVLHTHVLKEEVAE